MTEQLLIRMDPELKRRLAKLARVEGKTSTQVVRDLIEEYVKQRDIGAYIDSLWDRIGNDLQSKGAGPADVDRAVKEVRRSRAGDARRR